MLPFITRKVLLNLLRLLTQKELRLLDAMLHKHIFDSITYPEHLHYLYWEGQTDFWDNNPSPIRPSQDDIDIYCKFLQRIREKKRILILGSTPELRDLLVKEVGVTIYLADFSYQMPAAMLKFTQHVDPLKEVWIKANWLELPFPENFFDVILGDLILQQFPPDLELSFLKKMHLFLKEDGAFIGRFHFLDDAMRRGSLGNLIRKTIDSPLSEQQKFVLLKLRMLWFFADPARRKLHRQTAAQKFDDFVDTNKIRDPLLQRVRAALLTDKDSYRNWSPPEEKPLLDLLSKYFVILDKCVASDYEDAKYYPLFLLTPRPLA